MKQSRFQPWLASAALVTFAANGWAFQEVQPKPVTTSETKDAAEIAARRRAYEARQVAEGKQTSNKPAQGPQGTERALYEQEQAHRLRLGRIARLRALLRERGDTNKLAKLDEIAAKENLRYTRFTDIQKRKLTAEEASRAERGLARGRQRGAAQPSTREAAVQRERLERERIERERQKQDKKPKSDPVPSKDRPLPQHPTSAGAPVGGR